LLTTSFPRDDTDIAGVFVEGFAKALCARGHDVEVLAPEPAERVHAARPRVVNSLDRGVRPGPSVRVHYVPYLRPRTLQRTFYGAGVPDNLARDPLAWLGLMPFCAQLTRTVRARARSWDAIVSHWALPCALAASAAHPRLPHIAVLHSADVHLLSKLPLRTRLAQHIAQHASALWFVSEAQRAQFRACLPANAYIPTTIVRPMGLQLPDPSALIDDAERLRFRAQHGLSGYCVLLLGRLVPIKGIDVALRAAALGGVHLLIAGDGPARPELMRLAQRLRVPVTWLGVIQGEEKRRWLRAADAFALPSRQLPNGRSEGLPCALLEAIAYGLPVVASQLPGIPELLAELGAHHRTVPPEDSQALHRALSSLRESPTRQNVSCPSPSALQRFSWEAIAEQLAQLLPNNAALSHT